MNFSYLLAVGADPKTAKSNALKEYLTGIQYLSPGSKRVCPAASKGCRTVCLNTAGNPVYLKAKLRARKARTDYMFTQWKAYQLELIGEIAKFVRKAQKLGVKPAVRLNGTSDIVWELVWPELFTMFPMVQFYDYTKIVERTASGYSLPSNYDLTFSRSEHNWEDCKNALKNGFRVSVVFKKELPKRFDGFHVVNGDEHDLTFLRPAGVILGLTAKGKAKKDVSGFVVTV
jgi:hypothetical protein